MAECCRQFHQEKKNYSDLWNYFNIYKKCIILFFPPSQNDGAIKWSLFGGCTVCTPENVQGACSQGPVMAAGHTDTQQAHLPTHSVINLGPWSQEAQLRSSDPQKNECLRFWSLLPLTVIWAPKHLYSVWVDLKIWSEAEVLWFEYYY